MRNKPLEENTPGSLQSDLLQMTMSDSQRGGPFSASEDNISGEAIMPWLCEIDV